MKKTTNKLGMYLLMTNEVICRKEWMSGEAKTSSKEHFKLSQFVPFNLSNFHICLEMQLIVFIVKLTNNDNRKKIHRLSALKLQKTS